MTTVFYGNIIETFMRNLVKIVYIAQANFRGFIAVYVIQGLGRSLYPHVTNVRKLFLNSSSVCPTYLIWTN